jgi:ribonucleotide monophosphatase NagD (HAD superfamily)
MKSSLHPRSCWITLDGEGRDEFKDFEQDFDNPEYIVSEDNRSCFDLNQLNKVLLLLLNGSKWIGMQSERIDTSLGQAERNVSFWIGMLEHASGVGAIYTGKPNSFAFELTLQSMILGNKQVAMIGDRLSIDVLRADKLGIQTMLVRTGEIHPNDLKNVVHPGLIIDSTQAVSASLFGF